MPYDHDELDRRDVLEKALFLFVVATRKAW